jgi:PAS domain S-box-containing protein
VGMVADITERRLAEEKLREYEKAVEGLDTMLAVVDRDYRYLIANRKFLNARNMSREQVLGRCVRDVLSEGVFDVIKEKLDECFRGNVVKFEMKYTYPQLGQRDVLVSYFPIDGTAGVDRVACIIQDITDRKKAEEALRESEERFRLAAQAGKMYAYEWDVVTDVLVRTPEYVNVLGISEPMRFTRPQFLEKIHPDDRARFLAAIAELTPENPTRDVTYRVLLSGGVVWLKNRGRAFFDAEGRMLRVVGMVSDVTDQKLAEEALRASEERLRLAQQAARIGAFDWNIRTDVSTWTPELEEMYGLPTGGYAGTLAAFESLIHRDDRTKLRELIELTLKTRQPMKGEWRVVWPDGSVHWLAAYWQLLMDEAGEPLRVVGINMDITERKQAEEALAGMTRKLIDAQEQERSRIGRELHDDITQRLTLLSLRIAEAEENPSEVQSHLTKLRKEVIEISKDVQAVSHELHSSKLEYLGFTAGTRSWCAQFADRHKIEVIFHSSMSSEPSPAIGLALFRVLQEAASNAVKHSGTKAIEVQIWDDPEETHLEVSDAGRGFDINRAVEGKGLGLTSMRERVRLLKGAIYVKSKPDMGTTIHACVPRANSASSNQLKRG